MFLVVSLGCVSLGGAAGLLALPGRRRGFLGSVGGSSLPRKEGTDLLAAKRGGKDLPSGRGLYKTCRASA